MLDSIMSEKIRNTSFFVFENFCYDKEIGVKKCFFIMVYVTSVSWCDTSQVTSLVSYAIADRRQPLNPLRIWRCPHSF